MGSVGKIGRRTTHNYCRHPGWAEVVRPAGLGERVVSDTRSKTTTPRLTSLTHDSQVEIIGYAAKGYGTVILGRYVQFTLGGSGSDNDRATRERSDCSPLVHAPGALRRRREPRTSFLRRHAQLRKALA